MPPADAPLPKFYCDVAPDDPWHGPYHEREYGFPITDERALFERLILEINQAGLSWLTILRKRESFRRAFRRFDFHAVARRPRLSRATVLFEGARGLLVHAHAGATRQALGAHERAESW